MEEMHCTSFLSSEEHVDGQPLNFGRKARGSYSPHRDLLYLREDLLCLMHMSSRLTIRKTAHNKCSCTSYSRALTGELRDCMNSRHKV
jgi:hypothetical protein